MPKKTLKSISDQREGGVYNLYGLVLYVRLVYQTREREGSITYMRRRHLKRRVYQTREREGSITYVKQSNLSQKVYQTREREGSITTKSAF